MKVKDRKQSAVTHPRMLTLNDPQSMRINSELALEIGLNESIMLLQIEYLISISGHEHDGKRWTYQTLEDLREKYFRWWSIATISRTLTALKDAGFIHIDNFNKRKSDRTQWFALNPEGLANLNSITIFQYEKCILQDEKSIFQSATSILQDETALPETSTEITTENINTPQRAEALLVRYGEIVKPLDRLHILTRRNWQTLIENRLREDWTPEQIELAFKGCKLDEWKMTKGFNGVPDILTKRDETERLIELGRNGHETNRNGRGKSHTARADGVSSSETGKHPPPNQQWAVKNRIGG